MIVSSDTFPPARVDVAVLFGRELAQRGHTLDWLLQSEAANATAYSTPWGGGTVWVGATDLGSSLLRRIRKHVLGIWHDCKMFSLLKRGDYDAIEVKDKFISGAFAAFAARWYRVRFIYWLSYPFPEDYLLRARDGSSRYPLLYLMRGTAFKFLLYRCLLPMADHVFVQSEQMRRDLAAHGVALERMTAVPMGIDVDAFAAHAALRSDDAPTAPSSIVYLGTIARMRRLDFLIRVFAKVRARVPAAHLYMVGGGNGPEDREFLTLEAQRCGVAQAVTFTGQLPWPEALGYCRRAEVCVSPFFPTPVLNSTSPTKLVEYMAMSKPVVANDHPEQRLVIEQSGGGLCVPWNEEAFAAAILEILSDPARAALMGERGRRYAFEHRSYRRIADSVESTISGIASKAA